MKGLALDKLESTNVEVADQEQDVAKFIKSNEVQTCDANS